MSSDECRATAPSDHADSGEVLISAVDDEQDFLPVFDCLAEAFGRQSRDGFWMQMNPGWESAAGRAAGAARLAEQWRSSRDSGTAFYLKATLPGTVGGGGGGGGADERRVIVGVAIWSLVSDPSVNVARVREQAAQMYPDDELERRYTVQLMTSFQRRRLELLGEKKRKVSKGGSGPSDLFALDMCAVLPAYQRRGVATKLVRWGVEEAGRRGGLEAITEGSAMGRYVYAKLGFRIEGNVEFAFDDEFADRDRPSNVFMRTGGLSTEGTGDG